MAGPPPTWQFEVMAYVPLVSATLSVIGSSLIVCHVLGLFLQHPPHHNHHHNARCRKLATQQRQQRRTKNLAKPHLRILLAMSTSDILYSTAKAATFLLAPVGFGLPSAQGNLATCHFQGFMIQVFGHMTGAYNSALSIYYWLTICKSLPMTTWNRLEPYLHCSIWGLFLTLGITGLNIGLYNPVFSWCFIGSWPPGCESGPGAPPCERFPPQQLGLLYEVFAQLYVQCYFAIVILTNAAIWYKFYQQSKNTSPANSGLRSRVSVTSGASASGIPRHTLNSSTGQGDDTDNIINNNSITNTNDPTNRITMTDQSLMNDSSTGSHYQHQQQQQQQQQQVFAVVSPNTQRVCRNEHQKRRRQRAVAVQSILYSTCFCLSWTGPTLFHLANWITGYRSFWAATLIVIFTPMQGFFNAIVYGRPTYLRVRQRFPTQSRYFAFQRVFFAPDPFALPPHNPNKEENSQAECGAQVNEEEEEDYIKTSDDPEQQQQQECQKEEEDDDLLEDEWLDDDDPQPQSRCSGASSSKRGSNNNSNKTMVSMPKVSFWTINNNLQEEMDNSSSCNNSSHHLHHRGNGQQQQQRGGAYPLVVCNSEELEQPQQQQQQQQQQRHSSSSSTTTPYEKEKEKQVLPAKKKEGEEDADLMMMVSFEDDVIVDVVDVDSYNDE